MYLQKKKYKNTNVPQKKKEIYIKTKMYLKDIKTLIDIPKKEVIKTQIYLQKLNKYIKTGIDIQK